MIYKTLKKLVLIPTLFWSFLGLSQEVNYYPKKDKDIPFTVYKTTDTLININTILEGNIDFKHPSFFTQKTQPKDIYWIEVDLKNHLNVEGNNDTIFLKLNAFDYGETFFQINQNIKSKPIGLFDKNRISEKIPLNNYYSQIKISRKNLFKDRYLYLKGKRITHNEQLQHWNFSASQIPFIDNFSLHDFNTLIPYYILVGLCLLAFFWAFSFYLMLKNMAFIYYILYIAVFFIYFAGDSLGIYKFVFNDNYLLIHWFSQSFIFVGHIAYILYFINYLNTKKDYPLIHKICVTLIFTNLVFIILLYALYATDNIITLIYIIDYGFKIIYAIPIPALLYLIYIGKSPLAYFAAIATIALCISGLGRMYLASPEDGLYLDSLIYSIIGFGAEMIIFAFGLNYKVYQDLLEKFKLKKEAFDNKTKALRAQINPHFIFNSLSSIQHLVTKNDRISAIKYLTKFSRLTRNVLESSFETNMLLSDEIKMLTDYLELESLRFDNAFEHKINIADDLDSDSVEIPSMLLQPFVENAIIHGLLPKTNGDKRLTINFRKQDHVIIAEVEDNGVGRKTSSKKEHIHKRDKKSRGLEVTKQRLEAMGLNDEHIEIIDKVDEQGNANGTKAVIRIPLK